MRTPRTTATILLIVLVLCGLGAAYFYRTGISDALTAAKLVPEPETYTELYFNDADALPTSTATGQPITFSFTIHNVEGTSTVYPYVVYLQYPNGTPSIFSRNTVSLANGATTTIAISRTFRASSAEGEVVVELTSLNQQIDFLVNNPYQ